MADPMTLAIVGGAGLQIAGNIMGNRSQAKAARANARLFREQAELTLFASQQKRLLFDRESDQFFGAQVNSFAKAGVQPSGSALLKMASTKQQISNQGAQIIETGKRQASLSLLRANQADQEANNLSSFGFNLLQAGGTGLSAYGRLMIPGGGE